MADREICGHLEKIYDVEVSPDLISCVTNAVLDEVRSFAGGFNVNGDCNSCGICRNVCPARNIMIGDGPPMFKHQCESCLACIHHYSKRAINYMAKTQSCGRYSHLDIGHTEISRIYKG